MTHSRRRGRRRWALSSLSLSACLAFGLAGCDDGTEGYYDTYEEDTGEEMQREVPPLTETEPSPQDAELDRRGPVIQDEGATDEVSPLEPGAPEQGFEGEQRGTLEPEPGLAPEEGGALPQEDQEGLQQEPQGGSQQGQQGSTGG